jgi:hypothetical protein
MHLACRFLGAKDANRHARSMPPPAVARLSISVETNSPISDTGGLGPRVRLLGRRFQGGEKPNRRSRQYRASSGPPQKTEKFSNPMRRYQDTPRVAQQSH